MGKQKFLAVLLTVVMVLSLAACGNDEGTGATVTATPTPGTPQKITATPTPVPDVEPTEPVAAGPTAAPSEVSLGFEDGNLGFATVYQKPANADLGTSLAIAEFNGSNALQITRTDAKKVPFVAFDVSGLLGDNVGNVASVEMTMGISYADGSFSSVEGDIEAWIGADLAVNKGAWSVYLEKKNPNVVTYVLPTDMAFSADNNIMIISLKTDNGSAEHGLATLYIDSVRFLDASGNVLTADTSIAFAAPAGFEDGGKDVANLKLITNAVDFEGFALTGGSWGQNGIDFTPEILEALVPGSAIEIEYASEDGTMWIVLPDSTAGWMRVGDDINGSAYRNNSNSVAQIPYEMIVEYCGEDTSTWGARLQCESATEWEVFSVKVGTASDYITVANAVDFVDFAVSGSGWGQDGFTMPQEIIDALVPGSVIEISYASEDGTMWIVMPDSTAGWMRVGDGINGQSICMDGICYIPYELIAEYCGEDVSTWGARLQCEAGTNWEVFSVRVGTAQAAPAWKTYTEFPDFAISGSGWGQDGFTMPQEIIDALVPGSVVKIQYTSEDGTMWIVMPDSTAGWMRVGDGINGSSICGDGICYIPFEMIAEYCGDDVSTWGARMQCEAGTNWEVFGVSVGQ